MSALPYRDLIAADRELIAYARRIVDLNGEGQVHTMDAAVRDRSGRMYGGINVYHSPAAGHVRKAGGRGELMPRGSQPPPVGVCPPDAS